MVHPSPGHYSGTLVNALLHHCGLPAVSLEGVGEERGSVVGGLSALVAGLVDDEEGDLEGDDDIEDLDRVESPPPVMGLGRAIAAAMEEDNDDDENTDRKGRSNLSSSNPYSKQEGINIQRKKIDGINGASSSGSSGGSELAVIRPGIVHRLDKGTTGLMVVAKTDLAHASLADQFKDKTIQRTYLALTLGVPTPSQGKVATNIGRDSRDRKKMAAYGYDSTRGRTAVSNYQVIEELAGGAAALVQWRLETGRTHQIRVHAKHCGHPLLGDDMYGGLSIGGVRFKSLAIQQAIQRLTKGLGRPALHSFSMKFVHPVSGGLVELQRDPPEDFQAALEELRSMNF